MSVRIVRLGSPRAKNEGTRLGTVRRPPRCHRTLLCELLVERGAKLE